MNADSIRKYCLSFPHATENLQWEGDLCFKIKNKIFAILSLDSVPQRMCFKCTPECFAELCEREDVRPAPYVGRYKWVMLDRLDALRDDELRQLIQQSYEMVAKKAGAKPTCPPKGKVGPAKRKTARGSKRRQV